MTTHMEHLNSRITDLEKMGKSRAAKERELSRNPANRESKYPPRFLKGCVDCGQHCVLMGYQLIGGVWASTGLSNKQLCCQNCVEVRLGRKLHLDDYAFCTANLQIFRGYAMAVRTLDIRR